MKFTTFGVALKNLKRKSFRTGVLIFCISLLVCMLVFGASFVTSITSSIKRASDRLGADLIIVPPGASDFAQEVLLESKSKAFYMDRSIIGEIKKIEGVEHVTYHTYLSSIMGLCCDVEAAKIVVFDQDTDFIIKPWLDKVLKRRLEKGEALIGSLAYSNLSLLDVDSSVLFNKKFRFVGVLAQTETGLDNALFISSDNVGDIIEKSGIGINADQISLAFVKIKPGLDPLAVSRNIQSKIYTVDVIRRNDIGSRIINALRDINKVFLLTITLALVLSTFLAWSVFSAIANERIKEIGVMRAIGAKCSHIMRMFMLEVLLLGLAGSVLGIIFGMGLSAYLSNSFTLLRELSASITIYERLYVGALGLFIGTGICVAGAFSSILRLRRLDPLGAIKEI